MNTRLKRPLAIALVAASVLTPASAFAMDAPPPVLAMEPAGKQAEMPALAEIKVDKEQAIAAVKRVFEIPEAFGEPNMNIYQTQTGANWNINWHAPRNQPELGSMSADVDAITGEIRAFWQHRPMPNENAPLNYTREEAYKVAREWMNKLASKYGDSLQYQENSSEYGFGYYGGMSHTYNFRWDRVEKGYIVSDQGLNIGINASTGQLENFHMNWNKEATFVAPDVEVDVQNAKDAYRTHMKMRLMYQSFYNHFTDESEWRLVYQPVTSYFPNVSLGGELVDFTGKPLDLSLLGQNRLIPAADQPYTAPKSSLSGEEALAIARAVAGRQDEPTSMNYSEWGDEVKSRHWEFSWHPQGEMKEGDISTNVRVNADTGLVVHLSNWGRYEPPKEGQKPAISLEQAQEMAIEFIRKHRPDLAGSAVLVNDQIHHIKYMPEQTTNYYIRFQPLMNEIPVNGYEVTLDIDAYTGMIRYFWSGEFESQTGKFPSAEGIVTGPEALESFLKHQGLVPMWMPVFEEQEQPMTKMPVPQTTSKMQLMYAPGRSLSISAMDAKTGAPLDHQGRNLIELMKRPTDIEGHVAQREIELFWARGIFELQDGKFRPNDSATAEELALWLVMAKGLRPYPMYDFAGFARSGAGAEKAAMALRTSPNAAYWGAALQAGILLPEDFDSMTDPQGPVSRQQFALWAARAMGYGRVVKIPNRIEVPFADAASIHPKYANAVGLLHGLGVIPGDSGTTYAPGQSITRGEAAKILFAVTTEVRR